MNPRGHPETLVAQQPGNTNALKAGVSSPRALAPRVQEIEAEIASRDLDEVLTEILRRDLAGLACLEEAMDASIADTGVRGRNGEPRRMIDLRLRASETVRRALDRYEAAVRGVEGANPRAPTQDHEDPPGVLAEELAAVHQRARGQPIAPADFDPELFLSAVITTNDKVTGTADRVRAARMLARRRRAVAPTCTCIATVRARDALELREWIDDARESGVQPSADDRRLAALVRAVVRGGDEDEIGPFYATRMTREAVEAVIGTARRQRRDPEDANRRAQDPEVLPFWKTLLSAARTTKTRDRLDAFLVLDDLGVLPTCRCGALAKRVLAEQQFDADRAYVIRMVAEQHYRAALVIAWFPETHLAVRDAIDEALLAEQARDNGDDAEVDIA